MSAGAEKWEKRGIKSNDVRKYVGLNTDSCFQHYELTRFLVICHCFTIQKQNRKALQIGRLLQQTYTGKINSFSLSFIRVALGGRWTVAHYGPTAPIIPPNPDFSYTVVCSDFFTLFSLYYCYCYQ